MQTKRTIRSPILNYYPIYLERIELYIYIFAGLRERVNRSRKRVSDRHDRKTAVITRVTRALMKRRGKRGPCAFTHKSRGACIARDCIVRVCDSKVYRTLVKLAKRLIIRGGDTTFRSLRLLSSRFRPWGWCRRQANSAWYAWFKARRK